MLGEPWYPERDEGLVKLACVDLPPHVAKRLRTCVIACVGIDLLCVSVCYAFDLTDVNFCAER